MSEVVVGRQEPEGKNNESNEEAEYDEEDGEELDPRVEVLTSFQRCFNVNLRSFVCWALGLKQHTFLNPVFDQSLKNL